MKALNNLQKNVQFKLVLSTSSSHKFLARGHFLLVLVNDFVKARMNCLYPAYWASVLYNLLVPNYWTGVFSSPVLCIFYTSTEQRAGNKAIFKEDKCDNRSAQGIQNFLTKLLVYRLLHVFVVETDRS